LFFGRWSLTTKAPFSNVFVSPSFRSFISHNKKRTKIGLITLINFSISQNRKVVWKYIWNINKK